MQWHCLYVVKIMTFGTSDKMGFLVFGVVNVPNIWHWAHLSHQFGIFSLGPRRLTFVWDLFVALTHIVIYKSAARPKFFGVVKFDTRANDLSVGGFRWVFS